MTTDELSHVLELFDNLYPDWYGYTDWTSPLIGTGKYPYLVFRNRDESLDKANAIAILIADEIVK